MRLYPKFGWPKVFAAGNSGAAYIPEGSPGLQRFNPGSGYIPVPGDLIIENPTAVNVYGHVAVVDYVSGNTIYVVEQNRSNTGRDTYVLNGSNYSGGAGTVKAVMHAPQNTFRNPGSGSSSNLVANGGFEKGEWSRLGSTNMVAYWNGQVPGESARSGRRYLATNTSGGSVYTDVPVSTGTSGLICASAFVRTQYPATGAHGSFVLWLLGGSYQEKGEVSFSGLGNRTAWRQVQTCVASTTPHQTLRVEFYPGVGAPTLEIDDVDVHYSMVANGGFEKGEWSRLGSTNMVAYWNGQVPGESARSGRRYLATNTSGGSVYTDVPVSTGTSGLICASAFVRTQYPATGAHGSFVLWLLGGSYQEKGEVSFSGLGNRTAWRQVQTCVASTTPHQTLRVEFYPGVGAPTLEIDDVDVHYSMVANGGFEKGEWSRLGSTNMVAYWNGQVPGESARSGRRYLATNTSGGSVYTDVPVSTGTSGLICASAFVRTQYPATGAHGSFVLWLLGGSYQEKGEVSFSGLGNRTAWRQVQTCVASTTPHQTLRVEFYPGVGAPTLEIDDVDVH